ncbi:hypothetical protein JDS99_04955 [Bacillus cereus group sp. N6]|uniref:hypothetical protein n=1 Tax=Bacillus cereus group sp. N6 TaxID=2794583 RepID=UPI0018F367D2|nr:hypothetical protein [Bacillus cereus group sp. N6]MBJ8109014.1 hypothetical protein [Bacillus cereus group sp. N6]MDA1977150.1 hypothetical protein [Bacillus cereus]
MSEEQVKDNPVYVVEEEEEETITVDLENQTIYQKEEGLIVSQDGIIDPNMYKMSKTFGDFDGDMRAIEITPPKPTFQNELQDLLLNTVTSKAVASLLSKHSALDTELDILMENKRMGQLGSILDKEIDDMMTKRRMELRSCFIGEQVRYEKVPDWAKSYVREYIKNMIHGLSILVEDGE